MSHNFNDHYAAVTVRSRVNSVDCFRSNVNCRMKSERNIRSYNVIVYCFWKTDNVQSFLKKKTSCCVRAVSAKNDKRIHLPFLVVFLYCLNRQQSCICIRNRIFKRLIPCRSQNRSSASKNSCHITSFYLKAVAFNKSTIAVSDTYKFHSVVYHSRAAHTTYGGIQSRSIATGCKNTYRFYCCLFHKIDYISAVNTLARFIFE